MSIEKPRLASGAPEGLASVAVSAGPDEVVAAAVLGFDQAGVDRRREARIVQLDGEVFGRCQRKAG